MTLKTSEGDTNLSDFRSNWQEENLSEKVKKDLIEDEKYFLKQALSSPCLNTVSKCDGAYIIDGDGRKILDFHGNSVHQLGYNHPNLTNALINQMKELSFSPRRYANEKATECAKKLVSLMPHEDFKVLFTTSGAVSNETALKLARIYTGKHKTLSATDSFHGATFLTINVGGTAHFRGGLEPLLDYCYQFPHFTNDDKHNQKSLEIIENHCKNEDISAILIEPVRCTDVTIPKKEYLQKIRKICDDYNVVLIFDEIPTAFGRCGTMFSFENFGVTPDILTIGKGMTGGLVPFSAVIANKKFDICEHTSMGHFTFEKNPLASALNLALIDTIETENLLQRANEIGVFLKEKILNFKHELVYEVRQIGALVGIELRHKNGEKAHKEAEFILYKALEKGLSFKISGENVLTLSPSLVISDEELQTSVDILKWAFYSCHFSV